MNKNEIKKQLLTEKIVEVTVKEIHEMGYEQVTMEGIAKKCEITKRTLYKYFPVKEAIVGKYIQHTFESRKNSRLETIAQLESFEKKMDYYLRDLMQGVMREPIIFQRYLKYMMSNLVSDDHTKSPSGMTIVLEKIILAGRQEHKVNAELSDQRIHDFFAFIFVSVTNDYYSDESLFDMDKSVGICLPMFLNGIQ